MELRQLATFVAVADEASFSRAAERLHVVQSAVSAGIRGLERELGQSLFDRTTHRVALTDAGRVLLPEARTTLAAARAASEAVEQARGGLRGTVSLGILEADALAPVSVAALLAAFLASHPEVELHARHANAGELAAQVGDGRLDFAFLAFAARRAPGLLLTPLVSQPLLLAVAEDHPLAGRTAVELAATTAETFADGPLGYGTRTAVDQAFAAAGLQRRVALEVNDAATLIDFVRHRIAVAFVAPSFVRDPRGIALIPIRHHTPVFTTCLAEPTNRRLGAAAAALLALAKRSADV